MTLISNKVGRSVEIELTTATRHGQPTRTERGTVAVSDDGMLFGLVSTYNPERLTHMCYSLVDFDPVVALAHADEIRNGWFWFDAGTTCPEIKVSAVELRRAFIELGLIDPPTAQGE